jgi:hypothetical protein
MTSSGHSYHRGPSNVTRELDEEFNAVVVHARPNVGHFENETYRGRKLVKANAAPATVSGDKPDKNHWETGKVSGKDDP